MESMFVTIQKTKKGSHALYVPETMLDQFNNVQHIAFGTFIDTCTIFTHRETDHVIMISQDLWEKLQIPYKGKIHLFTHEETIHVGPLIGIFTAGFTDSPLRPVGERSLFFAKLLEVEQSVGTYAFIFGAHQIDWQKGSIKGFFHTRRGWKQIEVPFPHVVYNRLPNRKTEAHETLSKIKSRLQNEYLIPWFNPGFFNKWEIHEIFQGVDEMQQFLPETKLSPTLEDIKQYLHRYNHIYLKPANGSLGLGIHQIIYARDEGQYYCRYRRNDKNFLKRYPSLEKLMQHLFPKNALETYILQQGIALIRVDKKQIDFRIHTNKNQYGEWEMSAAAVKVAGPGSVTTHINSGGEIKTMDEIFQDVPERKKLLTKLEQTTLKMSQILDQKINGLIGEIGFDIGVDNKDNIWLFEANSKPGRSIFKHPKLKESDLHSRKLSLSYAIFLTEQSIKKPEALYQE